MLVSHYLETFRNNKDMEKKSQNDHENSFFSFCQLQLFWNMKTNLYTDEEGKNRDSGIADRLEYIMQKITESLSGSALDFYKREFDFFEKVTGISGEIK